MAIRIDEVIWRRSANAMELEVYEEFEGRRRITIPVGKDHEQTLLDLVMRCWRVHGDNLLAEARANGADPTAFF